MRRLAPLLPVLLSSACVGQASIDTLRAAVPRHNVLTVALVPPGLVGTPVCAPDGPASFGATAHDVSATVDGLLSDVLGIVDDVSAQPPSASTPGQAMWGPIPGTTSEFMLAFDQVDPTAFEFFLGGQPQGAQDAWQGMFGGHSETVDATHQSGRVDINFGVMHDLDASSDPVTGGAAVEFSVDETGRHVTAHFGDVRGAADTQSVDGDYAFEEAPDGTAQFAFATLRDLDGDMLPETVLIESTWAPDGRGTAHVTLSGGSLGATVHHVVECWDAAGGRVYTSDDADPSVTYGTTDCCAF